MPEQHDLSNNRITLIRLFCAIIVLVSHLDWIAGNSTDSFRRLGLYAVAIFFGLSGFLLTDSIFRSGANIIFIRNRILRIFPGFIGVLFLTSLFFAPIYNMIKLRKFQYTFSQENVSYIFRNMTTYILQSDINGSLETSNVPNWNPPLWTLSYEVFCYFLLFILIRTLKSRYFIFIKVFLPTLIGIYLFRELLLSIPIKINMVIYYASFFFLGSFLYLKKAYLKYHLFTFLILLSLLSFLIPRNIENAYFDNQDFVLGLFLVPISIFLSFNPKVTINLKNDYSFGIYIYSAPISQLLILIFDSLRHHWLLYAFCTFVVTFVFSWFSWNIIEKPALKLKKHVRL